MERLQFAQMIKTEPGKQQPESSRFCTLRYKHNCSFSTQHSTSTEKHHSQKVCSVKIWMYINKGLLLRTHTRYKDSGIGFQNADCAKCGCKCKNKCKLHITHIISHHCAFLLLIIEPAVIPPQYLKKKKKKTVCMLRDCNYSPSTAFNNV